MTRAIITPQPVRTPVRKLSDRVERELAALSASQSPERRAQLHREWEA